MQKSPFPCLSMVPCNNLPVIGGRGAWRDDVFVERLWLKIKYEKVYLHSYNIVPEARVAIGKYLIFYNTKRPHLSLDGHTPDQAFLNA